MTHKEYDIELHRTTDGRWVGNIRRLDGRTMIYNGNERPELQTFEAPSENYAQKLAIGLIDEGRLGKGR